jgi:hypothetical protein
MFVQLIRGKVSDADGLRRQLDRWDEELKSGAEGYLGATGGITADDQFVAAIRFESEDAAKANSERAEQGAWWEETSKCLDGDVTFRNCPEVRTYLRGGSDDAGFVQVMEGRVTDRQRLEQLEEGFMERFAEERPDVIGVIRAWDGDFFADTVYFLSEHSAREGESKPMAEDTQASFSEWSSLIEDLTFYDLTEPIIRSA